jgi:hypothetical protein
MRWAVLLGSLILCGPLVAATTQPASTQPAVDLMGGVDKPTPERPVTAAVRIDTIRITRGSDIDVRVLVRIAPGHWLYARTDAGSPFNSVTLKLTAEASIRESGPWQFPRADARGHIYGDVEFRGRLHAAEEIAPGTYPVRCELTYQACTAELCWPPRTLKLETTLTVVDTSP